MKGMHSISFILVIVGSLNWGLVAIGNWAGGNWNVVNLILGSWPVVENIVYLLVGLAAISLVSTHKRDCRHCMPGATGMGAGTTMPS
jgi:uncharacterized membrane protein YuzA (DUF378 family)